MYSFYYSLKKPKQTNSKMSFIEHMPLSWQCFLHFSENMTLSDISGNSNYPSSNQKKPKQLESHDIFEICSKHG